MCDNRFFDFMMQNEDLKKTMLLNKVGLIIFEAFRMWQETMGDISLLKMPQNSFSNGSMLIRAMSFWTEST